MVGTVGGEEQSLGAGARRFGVEEHRTDLSSQFCPTWFAGRFDIVALIGQRL